MRLGRYSLESRLGAGGFGEVWRGTLEGELGFRKPVAVKLLRDAGGITPSLLNEARIGARLHHPNVIDVYEVASVDGRFLLAMELVDGTTVEAVIASHPDGVPAELASSIVRQTALGLAYAHALLDDDGRPMGLVHRDLKPANLMLTSTGLVKILDFGLAVFRDATRDTRPGTVRGTPHYLAPEQVLAQAALPATDLWALGATAYALAMGRPLVPDGPPLQVLARIGSLDPDEAAAEVQGRVPALADIVRECLQADPSRRPTAASVAERLRTSGDLHPVGGAPAPSARTFELEVARPVRRWPWVVGVAAVVVGVGLFALRPAGPPVAERGGVATIGLPRERGTLDVFGRTRTMSNSVLPLVVEPLVRVDPDGEPVPWTLRSFTSSDHDATWLLRVRTDLRFHPGRCTGDGHPVTAADVAFSIRAAEAAGFVQLPTVEGGVAVVPEGIEVRLSEPMPFLPQLLQEVPLLPASLFGCDDPRNLVWPVGTGPFRYPAAPEGEKLELVRNDRWVSPDGGPPPWLDGIVLRTVADDAETTALVAEGTLQAAELLERPTGALPDGVFVAQSRAGRRAALKGLLALRSSPNPLTDPAARRALSAGVDRALVRSVATRSEVEPGDRILAPGWLGHDPGRLAVSGDPAALVGHGELLLGAFQSDRAWADAIAAALTADGVRIRVVTMSLTTLEQATTPGGRSPVDLALVELHGETWGAVDPWPYLVEFVAAVDEIGFVDEPVRAAVRAASRTSDRKERARRYAEVETAFLEGMPFVPLGWLSAESTGRTFLVGPTLGGFADPVSGRVPGDDPPFVVLGRSFLIR